MIGLLRLHKCASVWTEGEKRKRCIWNDDIRQWKDIDFRRYNRRKDSG